MPPIRSQPPDQYHHFIPQFILRRFRITQQTEPRSTSSGRIHVYQVSTGQLNSNQGCRRMYGKLNLYKDHRECGKKQYHIEQKFSFVEGKTSVLLDYMDRIVASRGRTVEFSREDLQVFHKFLFLMQYRASHDVIAYWRDTRPHLREWISNTMRVKELKDDFEFWLDCIQYILETSHDSIVSEAESIVKNRGGWDSEVVERMKKTNVDLSVNWLALEYTAVQKDYLMAFCKAADGTEFVLGSNSFGQTEEFTSDGDRIHLIYVISPRLAIIFQKTSFNTVSPNAFSSSHTNSLLDIQFEPPTIHFDDFHPEKYNRFPDELEEAAEKYRRSGNFLKDKFIFSLTELSPAQTQTVNNIVLFSVDNSGSLTFSSSTYALDTLRGYGDSDYTLDSTRYSALLEELALIQAENIDLPTKPKDNEPNIDYPTRPKDNEPNIDYPTRPKDKEPREPQIIFTATTRKRKRKCMGRLEYEFRSKLKAFLNGNMELGSRYRCATYFYRLASQNPGPPNNIAVEINKGTATSIKHFCEVIDPRPVSNPCYRKRPRDIPPEKFSIFVSMINQALGGLTTGVAESDTVKELIVDACAVGLLTWMAKFRPDILHDHGLSNE